MTTWMAWTILVLVVLIAVIEVVKLGLWWIALGEPDDN